MTDPHQVSFAAEEILADPPPAPRSPRRIVLQRLGRRSLTSRLITGVGSLVFILVIAIGASTYFALKSFLYGKLDEQVTQVTDANASAVQDFIQTGGQSTPRNTFRFANKVWLAVLQPSGGAWEPFVLREDGSLELMQLTRHSGSSLVDSADSIATVRTKRGETIRASSHRIDTSFGTFYVVSGLSVDDVSDTLRSTVRFELVIGAIGVLVALFTTFAGVRFSLRGLRRVTTTAQDVAAELSPSGAALQRRVPVTEKGTEVAQLTESFNTMLQSAETQFAARVESEERMRQFLADASHELRTPLTSIRGYAELARMQRAIGQASEDNLDRIESEGTRMSRLVEDLLLLARGDSTSNQPDRVPIVMASLVEDAVVGVRAAFPDRPIEIERLDPGQVVGDPDQLLRVVRNLITNAVVHTRPGPPIRVRSFVDGPGTTVQVLDGGPGLAPEDAAHVFERFWRADKARTRARGGSGLGLSIVATIVQAHGGSVRFDSSVEGGSTVSVWLPEAR